nr:MAG TPA: excisionase [Caudoviricetes sp.]
MPSDYLTKREREAMNGEVITYQMNKPMSWAQFKKMPDDTKREYINSIIHKYDPQQTAVAAMFGVTPRTLYVLCEELGIHFKRGGTQRENRNDAFWAWVNGPVKVEAIPKEPEEKAECKTVPETRAQKPQGGAGAPESGMLVFSNTTAQDAFNAAYALLTTAAMQKLVISWEAAHD